MPCPRSDAESQTTVVFSPFFSQLEGLSGKSRLRTSSSTCTNRWSLPAALGVLLVTLLTLPAPLAAHDAASLIEQIGGDDSAARMAATGTIGSERSALIAGLINVLEAGDPAEEAAIQPSQVTAIVLLGKLRAIEAVPALIRYLGFFTWDFTGESTGAAKARLVPLDEVFGAAAALIDIGRPATPALLDVLARSDDPTLWSNALWALQEIEGREALRLRVQQRRDRAFTDAERRRLERYLDGLN